MTDAAVHVGGRRVWSGITGELAAGEFVAVPGPNGVTMRVTEATIELNIAIAIDSTKKIEAGGGLNLQAFSVNASYARTFNFKEEASSKIRMTLAITPGNAPATA